VLISAGGFAQSPEMRRRYSGDQPNEAEWSHANPGDTGEVMQTIIDRGAATDMMDEAWWNPTVLGPKGAKHMVLPERTRPGSIMVDASGQRYFNEAVSYMEAGRRMYERQRATGGGVPSWLVIDARNRSRYMLGPMPPGRTPKAWIEGGHLKRADSLARLAEQCGMDAATLTATVERFNRFAESGVDEDFHRGEGAHERYQGDPQNTPNPCLAPLAQPPFYAIQVYPGDVGTCGGLLCNEHAQVLGADSEVMPGLYAAGNVTASVMGRTYPGAGASIGASTVFSFIAANHAASHAAPATAAPASVASGQGVAGDPNGW
jgi:3-oxosteroid 1-dehydrogenase